MKGTNTKLFHILISDPENQKLWYSYVEIVGAPTAKAILLHSNVVIYESIFLGTSTSTIGTADYIRQSYSVGYSENLSYGGGAATLTSAGMRVGVIMPTFREETCTDTSDE